MVVARGTWPDDIHIEYDDGTVVDVTSPPHHDRGAPAKW